MAASSDELCVAQLHLSEADGCSWRFISRVQDWLHRTSPIVTPDDETQSELQILTNEIRSLEDSLEQVEAIEREIDSIVFHVYGLAASERKLVLDWLGERRMPWAPRCHRTGGNLNVLRATAGAWRGSVDTEQLIEDIYASRLINTRPEPKL